MKVALAQKRRIRSPVGAGMFYPEFRKEMLDYIRAFGLETGNGGYAKAIIVPHGAWSYSGMLIADAFASAMGRAGGINRVVVLGPIHDKREKGIFLSNSYSFHTPLGDILVDREKNEELEFAGQHIEINDIPHLGEHSIEILLPFVKYCFPSASIVPILMGQHSVQYIHDLAQSLKTVITPVLDETLIVVSSNLSSGSDDVTARHLADECLRLFSEKDAPALASAIQNGRLNACGGALVVSLIESGLLEKTRSYVNDMICAVGTENNIVYYNEVSFV
jgi:MEMO1 family protein